MTSYAFNGALRASRDDEEGWETGPFHLDKKRGRDMTVLNQALAQQILELVDKIPQGRVATYGQLARLIGRPKNARLVAKIISQAEIYGGNHPCHRVVNAAGRTAPAWEDQHHLLWAEGVSFKSNGCVDMKIYQWEDKAPLS